MMIRNPNFFEEMETEEGNPREHREEGEEKRTTDDDPSQPGGHGD